MIFYIGILHDTGQFWPNFLHFYVIFNWFLADFIHFFLLEFQPNFWYFLTIFYLFFKNYFLHYLPIFLIQFSMIFNNFFLDINQFCRWGRGKGEWISTKSVLGSLKTIKTIFSHVRYLFLLFYFFHRTLKLFTLLDIGQNHSNSVSRLSLVAD